MRMSGLNMFPLSSQIYNRVQSGEYKVEDGWEGIKTGYSRSNAVLDDDLIVAEPAKSSCC